MFDILVFNKCEKYYLEIDFQIMCKILKNNIELNLGVICWETRECKLMMKWNDAQSMCA